jgi:hypothetical protein
MQATTVLLYLLNTISLSACLQNSEKWLLASSCLSLSVYMEQRSSHWTDFHELYLKKLWKFIEKIHGLLKSDKNNKFFTWRFDTYDNISLNSV